jgi:hypothetical protein
MSRISRKEAELDIGQRDALNLIPAMDEVLGFAARANISLVFLLVASAIIKTTTRL